jgi:hypothetical protein
MGSKRKAEAVAAGDAAAAAAAAAAPAGPPTAGDGSHAKKMRQRRAPKEVPHYTEVQRHDKVLQASQLAIKVSGTRRAIAAPTPRSRPC